MNKYHQKLPPEYWVWVSMRQRCTNPRNKSYANYGGRGISFSPEWNSFAVFLADMGSRPQKDYTLERLDNDEGYTKENCVWASRFDQCQNRRNTRMVSYNGETMNIHNWAEKLGLRPRTLYARLTEYGWPVDRAMTEGVKNWK